MSDDNNITTPGPQAETQRDDAAQPDARPAGTDTGFTVTENERTRTVSIDPAGQGDSTDRDTSDR